MLRRTGFKRKPTKPMKRTNGLKRGKTASKQGVLRKNGKSPKSKLKKKLWALFSKFIKERDGYICFTCGRKGEGSGMHSGHFIPRSIGGLALYFHEENVHAQCYNCNINLGGNQYAYGQKLGAETVARLLSLKGTITKDFDYDFYIAEYGSKLAHLIEANNPK